MWEDLTMQERAELIKLGVNSGLTDLSSIRNTYNEFKKGGPLKSYKDFKSKLESYWKENIDNHDYDYEKYYNDDPDRAYRQLDRIYKGESPHFNDAGKSGLYKKLNHPTYPDFGNNSWNNEGNVFYPSERQMQNSDKILNYLGSDLQYNNGSTKVQFDGGYVLPEITVTPNSNYSVMVPNKLGTGWVYEDSPVRMLGNGGSKRGKLTNSNSNANYAMNYFMNKGFTREQAAGIVGNFMRESSMNTNAVNPNSGAYGIGQWLGSRKKKLFSMYGNKPTLDNQLDFVMYEFNTTHKKGYNMIKNSANANDAATNAFGYYEFSAGPEAAVRAMNSSGRNTKWKNPNGTVALNKGIKNANTLLGTKLGKSPVLTQAPKYDFQAIVEPAIAAAQTAFTDRVTPIYEPPVEYVNPGSIQLPSVDRRPVIQPPVVETYEPPVDNTTTNIYGLLSMFGENRDDNAVYVPAHYNINKFGNGGKKKKKQKIITSKAKPTEIYV